jgi:hypothetical protein
MQLKPGLEAFQHFNVVAFTHVRLVKGSRQCHARVRRLFNITQYMCINNLLTLVMVVLSSFCDDLFMLIEKGYSHDIN